MAATIIRVRKPLSAIYTASVEGVWKASQTSNTTVVVFG
jgi:hypothetical protein